MRHDRWNPHQEAVSVHQFARNLSLLPAALRKGTPWGGGRGASGRPAYILIAETLPLRIRPI